MKVEQISGGPQDDTIQARGEANVMANEMLDVKERKRRRTSPAERREGKIVNAHEAVDSSLSETVHVKDGQKTRHRRSNQLQYETIKYNSGEVRSKSDVTGLIKEERKVNKPKLAELYEASTMKVPGEDDVGITKEGRRARKRKFDVKELFADEIRKRSRKNKTREEAKLREENRLLKNESSTSLTSRDELIKDAMKHCVKLEVFDNNPQDLNCCHTRRKSVSKTETRCQNSELSNKSPEAVKKQFETMTKTVKFSPNAKDASEMPEFQKNFPKQCTSVSNSETSDQNMSNASPTKSPQAVKTCLRQCRTAQEIHTYNKNGPECFKYKAVVKLHRIDFCTKPVTGQVDKNESISGFVVEEMDHKARFDITDTCKHKHANLEQGLETFDKESKMERETVKEFKIGAEKQEKVNVELALDTVRKESEIEIREAPERDLFLDQDCGPDGIENINQSTYQQHIYEKYYEANIEADAVGRTCNFGENSDDNTIHGNCKQPEAEKEVEYKRISLNSRTNFNSEDDDQTTNSNLNNFPDIAVRRNCEEINGSVNAEQKVEAADCEQQKVGNEDRRQRISVESGLRLTSVDENQTTTSNQNNFADNAVRRNCGGISDSANAEEKVEATYCEQQKIENQERRHRISGLGSTSSGENQVATPNQSNILDNATVIIEGNAKRINISATTVHKVTSAAENFEETTNKVEDEQMSNLGNTEQRVTVAENTKSATEIIRENDEKISSSVNIEQKGTSAAENRITLSYKSNIAGNFSDTTEANTNLKQANVELGSETVDGELKIEANPVERQKYLDQYCEPTSVSSNEVTTNINEDEKSSAGTTHDKRNVTREDQVGQSEMSPDEDGETCKKQTNICKEQTLSDTPCDGEWLTKKVREIFPPCLEDSESEINGCKQSGRRTITISKQYLDNLGLTLSPEKSQHPDDCYETMDSSQTAFHEKNANVKAKSLGKSCSSSEGPGLLSHNKRCKRKRESLEDAKNFSSASENAGSISPSTSPPPQRAKLYSSGKLSPPIKFQKLDQANKSTCKKPSSPIDGKKSSCIKGSVEAEDLSSQSSSHAYDSLRALAEIATQSLQQGKSPSKLNLENLNVEGKIEGSNQEKGNLSLACLSNTAKTILKTALGDKFPVATVNRKKIQGFNPTHTRTVNTSSITSGKVRATQEVSGISKKIVNASKTTMQTSVPVVSHTNTATFSKSSPHPLNFAMRALVPRERPNILRKSNPGSAPKQQLMRRWKAAGVDPSHISAKPSPKKQLSFAANIGNVISISSHAVNVMKSFNDAFQNKSTKSGFFLLPVSQNNATNKNVAGTAPSLVSQTKETVKHGEPKNVSVVYKTANDKTGSLTNGGANSVLKTTMSLDTSNGMIKTASSRTWTNVPELVAESGKSSNFVPGSLASSKVDQMTKSCKTQSHKEVTVNEGKYLAVSNVLTGVPQQSSFSQPPVVKPNSSPVMLVSQVKFPTALEKTVSVSAGQIAHESVTGPLETGPTLVCQKLQTSLVLRTSPTSDTSEPWKHRINPEQNMLVPVSLATPPRSVLETMPTATGGQFPLVALHSTARTLKNQTQQLSVSPAQVEAASVNSQAQRAFAGIGHQKQRILVKVNNQTAKASTNVNSQVQKAPTNISNQVQKIPIANGTQIQVGPASVNCSAQLPPANVSSYVPKSTEGYRLPTQITPMNTGSQMCPKIGTGKSKSQAVISGQSQQGPGNVTSQVQKSLTNLTSQTQKASSGVTSQTHSLTIKGPANFINQTQQRLTNGNGKTQNGITNSNSQTQKDHTSSSNRTQQEIGAVSKQAQRIVNNQRQQQPAVVNRQTLKGKSIVSSHAYESFPGSDSHTQKVPSEIANQTKHGAVVSSSQPQKFVSNQAKVGTVCDSNAHVGHTNAKSQTQIDEILNGQAETVLTTINSYVQKELAANKVRKELATIFSQTRSRGTINAPSETQKRPPSISTHVLQGSLNASTEAPKGTASVDSQAKKASTNISTQVHKGPASVSEPPKRTVTVDSQAKKVPKNIDSKACKDPTNAISRTKKGPLSVNSDTEAESTSTNVWAHSGGDEQNRSTSTNKGLADFSNQAQKGSESGRHDSPVEVTNGHSETKREPTISSFEALKDSASVKSGAPKRTASAASKALKVPTSVTVQLCKESRSTVGLKEKGLVSVNGAETKESTSTNVSENKGLTHISNQTQKGLTSRDNETQKRRSSMSVQVQKGTVNVNSQTQKGMADASGEMKRVTADAKSQMRKQLSRISAAIQKCPRNASWRIQETSSKLLQQNQQELLNFNSQMKSFSVNVPAKGSLVSIVMPQPLSSLQSVYVPVSGLATHQKTNPTVLLTKRASSLTPAHSTPSGPFHTEGQLASTNTTNQCVSTTETLYVPVDKNQLTTSSFPIVGPVVSVQQVSHTVFNPTTATSKYSKEKTRTVEAIKEQIKQNTNSQEPSVSASRHSYAQPSKPTILRSKKPQITFKKM